MNEFYTLEWFCRRFNVDRAELEKDPEKVVRHIAMTTVNSYTDVKFLFKLYV